jgi:hypothetical protein
MGQQRPLRYRQPIHIGPQGHTGRTYIVFAEIRNDPGSALPGDRIQLEFIKFVADKCRRAVLFKGKFRIAMQVPANLDHPGIECFIDSEARSRTLDMG